MEFLLKILSGGFLFPKDFKNEAGNITFFFIKQTVIVIIVIITALVKWAF